MFDSRVSGIELPELEVLSGESEDQAAYELTCRELADGWVEEDRHVLPDLSMIPAGPFLAAVLESVDRSKLNGFDLVNVLKARERMVSHVQADSMADMVEISYAAPGDAGSDPGRLGEAFEYAADELRAALRMTRRQAQFRLSAADDIIGRLPVVWQLLWDGRIDLTRARAFSDCTAHVSVEMARWVVSQLADVAPSLTSGQLRRRIRKLCITADPEDASKREQSAHDDRNVVIEPQPDGTADFHVFGLKMADARAIGRRLNGYTISHKKEDRSGRSHDQLRADIIKDLLLGSDPTNRGKGLVDIHVPVATLDGGDEPGDVGGWPVTAETARFIVESQPQADHQITLIDTDGKPTHIYTLSRRATKRIRRHVNALQPFCSFPGCEVPAEACDYDHLQPWSQGGETSTTNGGPKCDHDHELRDHGWCHQRQNNTDTWTSPLGHKYTNQPRSP